jgi:Zn-dependent metalloprotease
MKQRMFLVASLGAIVLISQQPAMAAPMMSAPQVLKPQARAALLQQLESQRAARGLDARRGFAITVQHPGAQGTQVVRVAHTFKGVPVFGFESVLVLDAGGKILSESSSVRHAAAGVAGLAPDGMPGTDFDVTPAISSKAAIDTVLRTLGAETDVRHAVAPSAELLIWPVLRSERTSAARDKPEEELNAVDVEDVVERYELAYLVHTRMHVGTRPVYHDTVVSARDGAILAQWDMLQTVTGMGKSQYNGDVPINTTLVDGKYKMVDDSRGTGGMFGAMAITNADHGTSAGNVYVNDSNTWGDGKQYVAGGPTTNANGQTAAVNAMWGLMNTYDALKNVLGWQSLDGHNTATYIAAHVNTAYDNAYYSDACRCMFIGDGSSWATG